MPRVRCTEYTDVLQARASAGKHELAKILKEDASTAEDGSVSKKTKTRVYNAGTQIDTHSHLQHLDDDVLNHLRRPAAALGQPTFRELIEDYAQYYTRLLQQTNEKSREVDTDWKIHKGYKKYDSVPKAVSKAYLKQATAFIRAKEEEDAAAAAAVADAATVTAKEKLLE